MKRDNQELDTYLSHRDALVNYATPITGCRARAEDIVQEAYLKVLPQEQHKPQNAIAYLYRTVRNLAIDLVRRSAMEDRHQDADRVSWLEPMAATSPEDMTSQHDELQRIADVISRLPESERRAIEMHRFGGHSMTEIARRLEVSPATVHRLIRNALSKISQALDEPAS